MGYPDGRENDRGMLHGTSRLRLLCALFSEFGYGKILNRIGVDADSVTHEVMRDERSKTEND
jgi:hypothetical protein